MAISFLFVNKTRSRVRYLATRIVGGGTTGTIPNSGGATPDLITDLPDNGSPMAKTVRKAAANLAAAQLILEQSGNVRVTVTPRNGGAVWVVRADVANAKPTVTVEYTGGADGNDAYVDIEYHMQLRDSQGSVG